MSLSNPLNILLLPPIVYLLSLIFYPALPTEAKSLPSKYDPNTYNWLPAKHPDVLVYKNYTPKSMAPYDGKDGGRILLAIQRGWKGGERTVFDVSAGRTFYGPDGMYGNFAGRDASRGMAKQSFDEDMLTSLEVPLDDLADLTKSEIDNMKGWHEHFSRKYIICGELVEQGQGDE